MSEPALQHIEPGKPVAAIFGQSIEDRCAALAAEARQLATDVQFRESLTAMRRGVLTETHVSLHSARLAARRLVEAIDRVADEADAMIADDPLRAFV